MGFVDLPTELFNAIFQTFDLIDPQPAHRQDKRAIEDLCNLRLTCKAFHTHATRRLFDTVRLLPTVASTSNWDSILSSDNLRPLVRELILDTFPEKHWQTHYNWYGGPYANWKCPQIWYDALKDIPRFVNVNSIVLRFSAECEGWHGPESGENPPETISDRGDAFTALFKVLGTHNLKTINEGGTPQIRKLTLANMQNFIPHLGPDELHHAALDPIQELHLGIITEAAPAAPETAITLPEVRNFWPDVTACWLKPRAEQLTALTLHQDEYWGAVPLFWCKNLQFPNLKSLELGCWTVAYEWQVEWLLSHRKLQTLAMQDCLIVHMLSIHYEFWDHVDRGALRVVVDEDGKEQLDLAGQRGIFEGLVRWDGVFEKIGMELQRLTSFRIGRSTVRQTQAFERRHQMKTSLPTERYCFFDSGCGPSQWITEVNEGLYVEDEDYAEQDIWSTWEEDYPGPELPNRNAAQCQREKDALRSLMQKLDQRALVRGSV